LSLNLKQMRRGGGSHRWLRGAERADPSPETSQ
jgi:hypothetical protein